MVGGIFNEDADFYNDVVHNLGCVVLGGDLVWAVGTAFGWDSNAP
jgi:hypothetical protein